jgi:DNA helicase-2/ATP-dependent DNA helicase PcrA
MPGDKIVYSSEQQSIIDHREGHLQIIAGAGSGKTETISRRCATLLKEGVNPEGIIVFTFTDRAAEELQSRIVGHVADLIGSHFLGRLTGMYIGTIHGFCLRFLQKNQPKFELYDTVN